MCHAARSPPNGVVERNVNQPGRRCFRATFPFKSGQIFQVSRCQGAGCRPNERSFDRPVSYFVRFHGRRIYRRLRL
jgi:hypothetical protein